MHRLLRKLYFIFIISILIIGGLFLFSQNSKSYDDKTTHPGLTDEIVDFYNLSFDAKLTSEEKEWIVQGAMNEDTPPRWINHFYDPIYKVGWSGDNTGIWPTMWVQYFSSGALSSKKPVSSLDWIHNQELQSKYGAYQGNRTWERAIYEAVKNGDKKEAYYTLGYILHLIEDAAVPDHTRNDTHAHELRYMTRDFGSPYEEFSKQYTRETLNGVAKEFKQRGDQPVIKFSIDDYLISLAEYSNKYFFSKDTIKETREGDNFKYHYPKIVRMDENFGYGMDENGREFPLALINEKWNKETKKYDTSYLLEKDDLPYKPILQNYFSRLSRQAVLNGAGVINLFNQEVAKAEKDKLQELPKESSAIWSVFGRGTQIYNFVSSVFDNVISETVAVMDKAVEGVKDVFLGPSSIDPMVAVANIGQVAMRDQSVVEIQSGEVEPLNAEVQPQNTNHIRPPDGGFPGGDDIVVEIAAPRTSDVGARNDIGEVARNDNKEDVRNPSVPARADDNEKAKEMTQEEIDALVAEVKIKYGLVDAQSLAVTQNQNPAQAVLIGYGGSGPSQIDNQSDENVQNQNQENQSVEVQSPVGQNNSEIATPRASDVGARNDSEAVEPQEPEPPKEPSPTFYLTDYDVRKMNFTLNWSDDNNVIEEWELEYKLAPNFDWEILRSAQNDSEEVVQNDSEEVVQNDNEEVVQNDSEENSDDSEENSYQFTAKYDDLTYYFRLRGSDADGNQTDWMEKQAEISTKPIAINEIAWRGTEAHHSDEWIELANKTSQEIDLNGWILKTHYGEINLILTGKIAANGFYLLERTADTTILNITADQIYTGALRDAQDQYDKGDSIYLYDNDNNIVDQTRTALSGRGHMERRSSERVNVWSNGNYWNNWLPYSGSGNQDAQDANSNPVFGTPRAQNSQANKYFALNSGVFEGIPTTNQDAIFLKNRGPYMANGSVEATNVEILIEPGASFDFSGFGMLRIHDGGELIAKGTENEKIIMKSSTSDRTVLYFSGAKGELENVEISGGKVVVNNSIIKIANSAIKNANGLLTLQNNSAFDISGNEFSGDNGYNFAGNPYYGEAILIKQSRGKIQNNAIKNNQAHGIYVESLSGVVNISGNNFGSNGLAPIATNGFINLGIDSLNLESNIIGANKALMVYNPFVNDGQTATISNKISYVLYDKAKDNAWYKVGNPEVKAGGILKIEPGAVVNFNSKSFLKISGHLEAMGALELPIIFRLYGDHASYNDMVSNISGTLTPNELNESDHIRFHDGSELALENVIIRREFVDRYKNTYYQSYWLVDEP